MLLQPVPALTITILPCRSVEKALQLDPSSDLLEQLLPGKAGDLELAKLPAPSRLVIYLLDGLPILLDTSGKGDYVPTVLGLWACPSLLPVVMLKHWQVSHYIAGGALGREEAACSCYAPGSPQQGQQQLAVFDIQYN
jgi:hypothetical protein